MTAEERTVVRMALNDAKRAWLKEQGGYMAVEGSANELDWTLRHKTRKEIARWLHRGGRTYREIGAAMGVSHATVCKWLSPTYAEKQRQWFRANREAHAARARQRYRKNREQILARKREAYAARKAA